MKQAPPMAAGLPVQVHGGHRWTCCSARLRQGVRSLELSCRGDPKTRVRNLTRAQSNDARTKTTVEPESASAKEPTPFRIALREACCRLEHCEAL